MTLPVAAAVKTPRASMIVAAAAVFLCAGCTAWEEVHIGVRADAGLGALGLPSPGVEFSLDLGRSSEKTNANPMSDADAWALLLGGMPDGIEGRGSGGENLGEEDRKSVV